MAIRPKTQVGTMACLCCKREVPVKAGESGTLNFSCSWCDFPGYAKSGTEAHRIVSAVMKPTDTTGRGNPPATPPINPAPRAATVFG